MANRMGLDERGFPRPIRAGDNPEFRSSHSAARSGLAQSGPFGAVKMLNEAGPEFRGEVVLAFTSGPPGDGFNESGLQLFHQFLLLLRREVADCFENFGDRAHGRKNSVLRGGIQAERERRFQNWQETRLRVSFPTQKV